MALEGLDDRISEIETLDQKNRKSHITIIFLVTTLSDADTKNQNKGIRVPSSWVAPNNV